MVTQLTEFGIDAASFPADVLDQPSLVAAFTRIKERYGPVDVLEYSSATTALPMASPTAVTHKNVQIQIEFYIHGAITAVEQVLPDMLSRGNGALLFTTGGSSVYPTPMMGNVGIAMSGLRNWAHTLHADLAGKGIYAGHVCINTWIGRDPESNADTIATHYYDIYRKRDRVEDVIGHLLPLPA